MQSQLAKNMIRSLALMMLIVMSHADLIEEYRLKQSPLPHDQGTCADDTATMLQSKMTAKEAKRTYDTEEDMSEESDEAVAMKRENSDEESEYLRPKDKTSKDSPGAVVKELQDMFDEFDEDSSGELECEELYQKIVAKKPHSQPGHYDLPDKNATLMHDAVRKLIASADTDGNGALSFAEFFLQQMGSSVEALSTVVNASLLDSGEFLEEDLLSQRTEVDEEFSDDANIQQIDEESIDTDMSGRRRKPNKKNKKQKEWAAKMILKNQETVCERSTYHVGWGRSREFRSIDYSWGKGFHCSGWDQVGLICYKPCRSQHGIGWHGVADRCYPGCKPGYINGRIGECHERCGEAQSIPQVGIECHGWIYCADSWGTCNRKALDIVLSFASFASNLMPYAKVAMKAAKAAKRAGHAFSRMVYAAIKAVGKNMLRKAKKNFIKYMRKEVKEEKKNIKDEIKEATFDAIFEGGAELVAAGVIKNREPDFGAKALEVAEAIDPTGVAEIVAAFKAKSCNNLKIDPMPADGFEAELPVWSACTWSPKLKDHAARWACTPKRHYSVGTSSYEECQTLCLEDWGSSCGSIEWRQGHECRTFSCKVSSYSYGHPWYVGIASSCPNYACVWNDRGSNRAAKWACSPIRHYNPGSYADCQQQCQYDHGDRCGAVEWRHGSECRTFGCRVTDNYYRGSWHVAHASKCPS